MEIPPKTRRRKHRPSIMNKEFCNIFRLMRRINRTTNSKYTLTCIQNLTSAQTFNMDTCDKKNLTKNYVRIVAETLVETDVDYLMQSFKRRTDKRHPDRDKIPAVILLDSSLSRNENQTITYQDYLEHIYYGLGHPGSFSGVDQLYNAVRKEGKYVLEDQQMVENASDFRSR